MRLQFEWDENKAKTNIEKHGVSFQEAATIFADTLSRTIRDPLPSLEETRFVTIGESNEKAVLVVIHTQRGDAIRIISARGDAKRKARL